MHRHIALLLLSVSPFPVLSAIVDIVARVKPISDEDWHEVYTEYCETDGTRAIFTTAGIRAKFTRLAVSPKVTGEGEMPPIVRRAKEAAELIAQRIYGRREERERERGREREA